MAHEIHIRTVVGFSFMAAEIIKEKTVRGCKHKQDLEDSFCSKCGEPMWRNETTRVDLSDLDYDIEESGALSKGAVATAVGRTIANFDVGTSKSVYSELEGDWFKSAKAKELEKALRKDLAKLGLNVKDKKFGIFTVVFHMA